jgi:hypothetical protein
MDKDLPVKAISMSLKLVSCCTATCTLPSLRPYQCMVGWPLGGERIHGVHGGVAGDCAASLMPAFVELDVDGRLSIMRHLKHAILEMAPNRVHCVGVSPGWHLQRHHVVDGHSGGARARLACAREEQRMCGAGMGESGQDAPGSRRRQTKSRAEQRRAGWSAGRGVDTGAAAGRQAIL